MGRYFLANHAFLCEAEDYPVVLDIRRDRYIGIAGSNLNELRSMTDAPVSDGVEEAPLLAEMLQCGLLVVDRKGGKPISAPDFSRATVALIDGYAAERYNGGLHEIAVFIYESLRAALALRLRSLEGVLKSLSKRARPCSHCRNGSADEGHLAHLRRAVTVFMTYRPYLFTPHKMCLRDSIALVRFLSHFGHCPTLMIGVSTRPFGAHCWVQTSDYVLNDTPQHIACYTPIYCT